MSRQGHHSSAAPNNCVIIGNNNSYLVKRNTGGGVQFSRDPLNLANVNSRKVRTSDRNRRGARGTSATLA